MKRLLQPIAPTLAVDPGAGRSTSSATGIVAVIGTDVAYATNCHRRDSEDVDAFAQRVFYRVKGLRDSLPCPGPGWSVAVEGVVAPQGHIHGRPSRVTPDQVIGIAIIYGVIWKGLDGYRVRPGKAGLAHAYTCATPSGRLACRGDHEATRHTEKPHCPHEPIGDYYPASLIGRRPPGWTGEVGTREHEQEAYDIAFLAWERKAREELTA